MVGEQVYSSLITNQRHGCLEFSRLEFSHLELSLLKFSRLEFSRLELSLYQSPTVNLSLSTDIYQIICHFIGSIYDSSTG